MDLDTFKEEKRFNRIGMDSTAAQNESYLNQAQPDILLRNAEGVSTSRNAVVEQSRETTSVVSSPYAAPTEASNSDDGNDDDHHDEREEDALRRFFCLAWLMSDCQKTQRNQLCMYLGMGLLIGTVGAILASALIERSQLENTTFQGLNDVNGTNSTPSPSIQSTTYP